MSNTPAASEKIDLEVHSGDRDLQTLRRDWEAILCRQARANLFTSPLWVVNYWRFRTRAGGVPEILVGRARDGTPVGLVPLVREPGPLGRLLPTLRAAHATGEYESDWICAAGWERPFVAAVCDYLTSQKRGWFELRLNVVRDGSPILEAMCRECDRRGLRYRLRPAIRIPFVPTDPESSPLEKVVSGKYRRGLRRRRRLLEKLGSLRFEVHQDGERLEERFEEFLRVEGANWKGREGTAIQCEPDAKAFWWRLAQEAVQANVLRLHLLKLDGRAVSGEFGIVWAGRYYCLKVGYDETYRQYGPGALMTQHLLEYCFNDPLIQTYDFAGPAQPYMANWTDRYELTWQLSVGSPSLVRGTIYKGSLHGRAVARRIRSAFRSVRKEKPAQMQAQAQA